MPVKINDLVTSLAKKVGYNIQLLAFPSETFEVPDDLSAALEAKLFTEDAARNNPDLKKHFFKAALDGVDLNIQRIMDEMQLDEQSVGEITSVKSTYERIPVLAKKIRDLESQKASASKGDKAALQEQINLLNSEKARLIQDKDKEIQEMQRKFEKDFTDNLLRNRISAAPLLVDQFGKEVMEDLAYKYVNQELTTQDARVVQKNGVLKLVKASDEALDFYADNKAISVSEFLDSVLAKYKLIQVNKPAPPTGSPNTPAPPRAQAPNDQSRPANTSFQKMLSSSIADLNRQPGA